MTLMSVSIIDISPYWSGEAGGRQHLAQQINEAYRDIGFLLIAGHRVPETLIHSVDQVSREFFDLSLNESFRAQSVARTTGGLTDDLYDLLPGHGRPGTHADASVCLGVHTAPCGAPMDAAAMSRRQSLVFFHHPNYDAVSAYIPSCQSPGSLAKYPVTTSGEHLHTQFVRTQTGG
jgi:isopenicillin N synthase-like dioxygenase